MIYKPNEEHRQVSHVSVFGQLAIRISLEDFDQICIVPGDVVTVDNGEYLVKDSKRVDDSMVQVNLAEREGRVTTAPLNHPGILGDIFKPSPESFSSQPDMYIARRWRAYVDAKDSNLSSEAAALLVIAEVLHRKNQCLETQKTPTP